MKVGGHRTGGHRTGGGGLATLFRPAGAARTTKEATKSALKNVLDRFGEFGIGSSAKKKSRKEEDKKDGTPTKGSNKAHADADAAAAEVRDPKFAERLEKHARYGGQRFLDVFNAVVVPAIPDFVAPIYLKTQEEKDFISDAIKGCIVFEKLRKHERIMFVNAFEKQELEPGTVLIRQGDKVRYFYIVQSGTVVSSRTDGETREVVEGGDSGPGDFIGELALLYDYPSEVTRKASTACVVWRLDQITFKKALAAYGLRRDKDITALLKKVPLFRGLDSKTVTAIAASFVSRTYQGGEPVLLKSEPVKSYYIIQEGSVQATQITIGGSQYDDVTFKAGDSFGEAAILDNVPLEANVTCTEDSTTILTLPRDVFMRHFGNMEGLIQRSTDKKKLRAIPIKTRSKTEKGRELDDDELEIFASLIKNYNCKKGQVFVHEGLNPPNAIYFVRSGKISIKSSGLGPTVETLLGLFGVVMEGDESVISTGGYFGAEGFHEPGDKAEPALYTATALEDCSVGVLKMSDIWSIFVDAAPEGEQIPFKELQMYKVLGAGTFGKVWLCSQRKTDNAYALKVQSKRKMIDYGQVDGVIREKKSMSRLNNPFIIKLVSSYKDERFLYMLTELYQGGELRPLLSLGKRPGVPEPVAAFYSANMLLGLQYMHQHRILHRDLKPENVLLNNKGYTVLVDLGFARVVTDKTYTFCGTPMYIAPEVILQKGYGFSCDIWSWGIMLYELIVGITPFYDGDMTQMQLFEAILKGEYDFPTDEDYMSAESKNLIQQLLVTDPNERLGCLARAHDDIRRDEWFGSIPWDGIDQQKAAVPWVPPVKDPLDAGNFDDWSHLEDNDEEEKPLSSKDQAMFDNF